MFNMASHGKVGMWMFLATDALTFSGFLIGYGVLRARNPHWPDPESMLGIPLSALATTILIISSVTMVMAQAYGENKQPKVMAKYLLFTALGGMVFLGIQAYEYTHLAHAGMIFSDFKNGTPQFASTFYMITGFHGLHVLIGTIYLWIMYGRTLAGKYDSGDVNEVEICGLFWHFVDLVWILVFTFIYLV